MNPEEKDESREKKTVERHIKEPRRLRNHQKSLDSLKSKMKSMLKLTLVALVLGTVALVEGQFSRTAAPVTFPDNINLATITPQAVDQVLRDKNAVLQLVECFEHESRCVQRGALSFVRQVRRLGPGGRCIRCTPREQNHIRAVMRRTVAGMQRHHPAEWRRIVPHIRNIF